MAMATIMIISASTFISKPNLKWKLKVPKSCISNVPIRRSGNYQPSIWDYNHIQSLKNHFSGEKFRRRRDELKMEVKIMLSDRNMKQLEQLEIIDNLQRLGLSYHFEDEICNILNNCGDKNSKRDHLYAKALEFRLLRQHGFNISQDIFDGFYDNITAGFSNVDTKGMLYWYEASFLAIEGEKELELARNLTEKYLREYLADHQNKNYMDQNLVELVHHALELPLHWRMLRLETKWFINYYKKRQDMMVPCLLELASLDFNIVQATHIEDLKYVARWWKNTGLAEKLPFTRDILVENLIWSVGALFEPQHSYFRRMITKVTVFISIIDDIYDVYGTLDELEFFTYAIQRWDTKAMEQLPDYMKVCYLALFNIINEMAYEVLKDHGINVLPYLTKSWTDLCKSYLQEARWYHNGYKPSLEEYMDNARISIAVPMALVHSLFLVTNPITKEALDSLTNYPDIIRLSATIFRFNDDLGTFSDELKRGDVFKSIQCYMNEKGGTEEEAKENITIFIKEAWEAMNTAQRKTSPFSETFIEIAKNISRTSHFIYLHTNVRSSISKILFEPIDHYI